MLDRDAIYQALFDRLTLKLAGSIIYSTRRLDHFETVDSQPAMLVVATTETANHEMGLPPVWTLGAEVYLYLRSTRSDATPETELHALVGKIEDALAVHGEQFATDWGVRLGGLVRQIYLKSVEIDTGLEGGQGVAVVRLEMTSVST